jgi:hypothetical protein
MIDFKLGDKVVFIQHYNGVLKGSKGVVTRVIEERNLIRVRAEPNPGRQIGRTVECYPKRIKKLRAQNHPLTNIFA